MMWSWGLLLCALVACLIHSFFIRRMGLVTQEFDKKSHPKDFHGENSAGVSVIVCAKNEAARLDELIPKILDQNYPEFELLVVDDHSQDNTSEILDFWQKKKFKTALCPVYRSRNRVSR